VATVFVLLTQAHQIKTWFAHYAEADAPAGGVFCLADPGGLRVEGTYLEIISDRKVMMTWCGIEGLRSGQSMVAFALNADGNDTVVRLRHSGLSTPAVAATGGGIASPRPQPTPTLLRFISTFYQSDRRKKLTPDRVASFSLLRIRGAL
jgi:uncharacterized protein YndB with AHSA1/START domain